MGNKNQSGKLNKKERMQLKVWICVLGIFLLLFLMAGQIYIHMQPKQQGPKPLPHIPVLTKLSNVWLIEVGEDNLLLYRNGQEESYDYGTVEAAVDENGEVQWDVPVKEAKKTELHLYQPDRNFREQLADVILTDGRVTDVIVKTEKVHGVILSADETSVEVEGYGQLPLSSDYRGYRIFNTLAMCTYEDLAFGYDFADLIMEDGEVCGILMVREETMDSIRVLVKTGDFESNLHKEIVVTADTGFKLTYGSLGQEVTEEYAAGDEIIINPENAYFSGERIMVKPVALTGKVILKNVSRSQGVPGYRGHIELIKEGEEIAVVNEVSLEEYLYSVVPSEMPASYPKEALKAQAICARTYAYGHMQHAAYPAYGAHVDDSTSYQVYNNILENESTTGAVKETYGQLLKTAAGSLAGTYYYSTSCGVGSDANVWKTDAAAAIDYLKAETINETTMQRKLMLREQQMATGSDTSVMIPVDMGEFLRQEENFAEFITSSNKDDFESGEGWYRWTYKVKELDPEHVCEALKKRYKASKKLVLSQNKKGKYVSQDIKDFDEIKDIFISKRGSGGVADELILETNNGIYKVITEHNIRYVLCDGETKVVRQNGSQVAMPYLLPSGFFIIETEEKHGEVVSYNLTGGGFGHGAGMSQNAARAMAAKGYTSEDILLFFYENCNVESAY